MDTTKVNVIEEYYYTNSAGPVAVQVGLAVFLILATNKDNRFNR